MVICYQILASDVADHLPEYATLKAIGYTEPLSQLVVLQEVAHPRRGRVRARHAGDLRHRTCC